MNRFLSAMIWLKDYREAPATKGDHWRFIVLLSVGGAWLAYLMATTGK